MNPSSQRTIRIAASIASIFSPFRNGCNLAPAPAGAKKTSYVSSFTKRLPDINLEERVVVVVMAPGEVLLLLAAIRSIEVTIVAVLVGEVLTISAIFVVVPGVVVFALFIVIALFLVIFVVSSRCDRSDQSGGQCERAQN